MIILKTLLLKQACWLVRLFLIAQNLHTCDIVLVSGVLAS